MISHIKKYQYLFALLLVLVGFGLIIADQSFDLNSERKTELEEKARTICEKRTGQIPPEPFSTDACTLWPNSIGSNDWTNACIRHDMAYWCGGSLKARQRADNQLAEQVGGVYAYLVYPAVRFTGLNCLPTPWRWGYGYGYTHKCLQ
jgi:hypothetical protein